MQSGSITQTHDTIFTTYKYPGILSNRDALSSRSLYVDKEAGRRMIMWRSTWHPDYPPTNKFIRTWTFGCYMVCDDPNDPNSCIYYSFGMVDARGWLPDWFVTQFCPTGIKTLCKKVSKCCIRYQQQMGAMPVMERKTSLEEAIQKVERVALGDVSESDGGIMSEELTTSDGGGAMSDGRRRVRTQSNKKFGGSTRDGAVSDGGKKKSDKRKEKMTKFVIGMAMGGGAGLKTPNLKGGRSPKGTTAKSPLSPQNSIKRYFKKKFKKEGEGDERGERGEEDHDDVYEDGENDITSNIQHDYYDFSLDEEPDSVRSEGSIGDDEDDDLGIYSDTMSGIEERDEGRAGKKKKKGLRKSLGGAVDSIKDDYNILKERLRNAQEARKIKNKIKKERKRERERIKREQRDQRNEQRRLAKGNSKQNFSIFSNGSKGVDGYRERGASDSSRGRKASEGSRHRDKAMSPKSISRFLSGGSRERSGPGVERKMSLKDKFKKKLESTKKKKLFGRRASQEQDEKPESL